MTTTDTTPTPNADLIRRTVAHMIANPAQWDQTYFEGSFVCGTTRCFGGTALVLHYGLRTVYDAPVHDTEAGARTALGLTFDQAEELFYAFDDTLPQYVARVERVTGVRVTDLLEGA